DRLREDTQARGELAVLVVDVAADLSGVRGLVDRRPVNAEVVLPARHQRVIAGAWRRGGTGARARGGRRDDQADQECRSNHLHGSLPLSQSVLPYYWREDESPTALVYGTTCFGLPGSTVSGRHDVSSRSSLFIRSGDRHLSHSSRVSNVPIADRSSAAAGVLVEGTANFHNVQ